MARAARSGPSVSRVGSRKPAKTSRALASTSAAVASGKGDSRRAPTCTRRAASAQPAVPVAVPEGSRPLDGQRDPGVLDAVGDAVINVTANAQRQDDVRDALAIHERAEDAHQGLAIVGLASVPGQQEGGEAGRNPEALGGVVEQEGQRLTSQEMHGARVFLLAPRLPVTKDGRDQHPPLLAKRTNVSDARPSDVIEVWRHEEGGHGKTRAAPTP